MFKNTLKVAKNKTTKEKVYKRIYDKSVKKAKETEAYIQNKIKIMSIQKALNENASIPTEILDNLTEAVRENTKMEYEFVNRYILSELMNGKDFSK